ncbi:MAG: helix-turn-helix domain-containing protein [Eubacteriaceae bacterium]
MKVYLDCHQNIAETVRRLHVHRNTFLYQLERIREITAMDLQDADTAFLLSFVLRLILK